MELRGPHLGKWPPYGARDGQAQIGEFRGGGGDPQGGTSRRLATARRYHFHLDPQYPQSCSVEWQITFAETTPFALESEIYNRLKEISTNDLAVHLVNGSDITLTATELETLKAIKPWQATSHSLRFIQTLTFADGREAQWPCRYHNHKRWFDCPNQGFE